MVRTKAAGLVAALCSFFALTPAADAQVGDYQPGTFTIAGYPFSCGNAVVSVRYNVGDLGKAAPGQFLVLDAALARYPPEVIGFVFTHECAHFMGEMNEDAADAIALQTGKRQGWISPYGLQQICQSVFMSPGDWTHFPGPVRCQRMTAYYNNF